jgi:hypothetical protein
VQEIFWFWCITVIWQALERFSLDGIKIADTLVAQGRILMFWYWSTYLLLKKNRPKYQPLLPPMEEDQNKQVD